MKLKKLFKRKKEKTKPVLYDEKGQPIFRPKNKGKRKRHKFQRPSMFTDSERERILFRLKKD